MTKENKRKTVLQPVSYTHLLEGVFGNKTYVMDASGNASPKDADNAFYWKNTDEARVSAWTPRQYDPNG